MLLAWKLSDTGASRLLADGQPRVACYSRGMASVLDIDDFRRKSPPSWWVDLGAPDRQYDAPRGWSRTLRAVTEVMFADDDGLPSEARMRWLCAETKNYVDSIGGKGAFVFRLGLFATDWIAPLFVLKPPPLRRMHWVDRVIALKRYEASPFGLSLFAVKAFASMVWFEHPEVAAKVGFDGAPRASAS